MRTPPTTAGTCDWPKCHEKSVWIMDWLEYCNDHQLEATANRAKMGATVVTPIFIGNANGTQKTGS
jgi:hypothetical protein